MTVVGARFRLDSTLTILEIPIPQLMQEQMAFYNSVPITQPHWVILPLVRFQMRLTQRMRFSVVPMIYIAVMQEPIYPIGPRASLRTENLL